MVITWKHASYQFNSISVWIIQNQIRIVEIERIFGNWFVNTDEKKKIVSQQPQYKIDVSFEESFLVFQSIFFLAILSALTFSIYIVFIIYFPACQWRDESEFFHILRRHSLSTRISYDCIVISFNFSIFLFIFLKLWFELVPIEKSFCLVDVDISIFSRNSFFSLVEKKVTDRQTILSSNYYFGIKISKKLTVNRLEID